MSRYRIKLFLLVCIITIVFLLATNLYKRRIKHKKIGDAIQAEKARILGNQSADGAFFIYFEEKVSESDYSKPVNPYFSCIAARGLLKGQVTKEHIQAVKNYIDWHINHLEDDGSIMDYRLFYHNESLVKEEKSKPDSIDSYCALFLSLISEYYNITEDKDYMIEISKAVDLVAERLMKNQLENGLMVTFTESGTSYLMDNIEVNEALRLYKKLYSNVYSDRTDMVITKSQLEKAYQKNTLAIKYYLWDYDNKVYFVGVDSKGGILNVTDKSGVYPYWSAQLYPQLYGFKNEVVIDSELYKCFCRSVDWTSLAYRKHENSSYWCVLSYIAIINKDEKRAKEYLASLERSLRSGINTGYYIAESSFLIGALEKLME